MAFYLIRHGETEFNQHKKMQGWLDIELNEIGHQQAEYLANFLVDKHFDYVYSSDLKRAYQTAESFSRISHQHIIKDEKLREIRLGLWEGKTWKQVKEEYDYFFNNQTINHTEAAIHGGESLVGFQSRVVDHFKELAKKHINDDVLIFTHGGNIRVLLLHILDIPLEKREIVHVDNASMTIINYQKDDDAFVIIKQNEIPFQIGEQHGIHD